MKGRELDLSTDGPLPPGPDGGSEQGKPFIGVKFECCSVYSRVYLNQVGDAYEGRCPRCAKPIRFEIGPGGTSNRFFSAS